MQFAILLHFIVIRIAHYWPERNPHKLSLHPSLHSFHIPQKMKATNSPLPPSHPPPPLHVRQGSGLAHRLPLSSSTESSSLTNVVLGQKMNSSTCVTSDTTSKHQKSTRTQHHGASISMFTPFSPSILSPSQPTPTTSSSSSTPTSTSYSTSNSTTVQLPRPSVPPPTSNTQKRVGFERKTKIYLIPSLSEYTDDEIDACWIGEEDTKISQDELASTIMLLRQNNGSIPGDRQDDLTIRGIEHLCTQAAMERRKATRQTHINAVLDEQDDHWDKHATVEDQEEAIQQVSSIWSARSTVDAIARAAQDEAFLRRRLSSILSSITTCIDMS